MPRRMDSYSWAIIAIIAVTLAVGLWRRFELTFVLLFGLAAIMVAQMIAPDVYLVETGRPVFHGNVTHWDLAFRPLYLDPVQADRLYTVITSMFIHSGPVHLFGNMVYLLLLGVPLEQRIGRHGMLASFFIGGIAGVLLYAGANWGSGTYLLGASGAISGLVGTLFALYPKDRITMMLGPIILPNVPVWAGAMSWFVFSVALHMYTGGNVAWEAHLGGFMGGLLAAVAVGARVRERKERERPLADLSGLERLATTPRLMSDLDQLRGETDPAVRRAWLEDFAQHAKCPECGSPLELRKGRLECQCGFRAEAR